MNLARPLNEKRPAPSARCEAFIFQTCHQTACLKVVAHFVQLEFMGIEDAPHRGFSDGRQPCKACLHGMHSNIAGRNGDRPQLGRQSQFLGAWAAEGV